jgi:hypothetical protein
MTGTVLGVADSGGFSSKRCPLGKFWFVFSSFGIILAAANNHGV